MTALLVLALVGCGGGSDASKLQRIEREYGWWHKTFPGVESLTPEEARAALDSDAPTVLVDVRTDEEQAVSRLPGAITDDRFEAEPGAWRDHQVIAYCTIGARSGSWAAERQQEGFDVVNIEGGLLAWAHAGLPLVTPEGEPTETAHVHSRPWNLLPEGYKAVW